MIIDVHKLGSEGHHFDRPLRLPDLPLEGGDPVVLRDLRIRGSATRGTRGVDLRGHLSGRLLLQCSRCLESFES